MYKTNKHWWVYVLAQEQGKYYVGITSKDPEKRLKEHQNGFMGAKWTKKYRPIKVIEMQNLGSISRVQAEETENKLTRKFIELYGLENVRGGDITYSGKLFNRFGRLFSDNDWEAITIVAFLLLVILVLLIKIYI